MRRAFTLVELLAAMAVFVLVALLGAALVSSASGVTRTTMQRTSVREEARMVFDRLALDISTAIHFDTYQIQSAAGTNNILSLLSSVNRPGSGMRLQRIDYRLTTNGLFRSVREVGWNDSQDLSMIAESGSELLSPAVGQMIVQSLQNDGTIQSVISNPSVRIAPAPAGIRVGLVLAATAQRKARALSSPVATVRTSGSPWISLSNQDEHNGWRVSDRIFRLP